MTLVCLFAYYHSSYYLIIDHFTVVCLASWPLNGSKAGGDLVFDTVLYVFCCANLSCSYTD